MYSNVTIRNMDTTNSSPAWVAHQYGNLVLARTQPTTPMGTKAGILD
jgi:hypothetical protein